MFFIPFYASTTIWEDDLHFFPDCLHPGCYTPFYWLSLFDTIFEVLSGVETENYSSSSSSRTSSSSSSSSSSSNPSNSRSIVVVLVDLGVVLVVVVVVVVVQRNYRT